jgi:hypothetical protein
MTVTVCTPGVYNPTISDATPGSTAVTVVGVMLDYTEAAFRADGDSAVLRGDRKAIISAQGLPEVGMGDTLTVGGEIWSVVRAKKLNPAGTVVIHTLQVRK